MSRAVYTDLELDNVFATSGVNWKQEGRRLMVDGPNGTKIEGQIRVYDFHLLDRDNKTVHTIKGLPTIEDGKQTCARWCVENRGGRARDMSKDEVRDAEHADLKDRLAKTEGRLEALSKASKPRKKAHEANEVDPEVDDANNNHGQDETETDQPAEEPKKPGRKKKAKTSDNE